MSERRSSAPDGRPEAEQPTWRREFPVDAAQDQFIARRDFTRFMVLTSLAFVVGQFWIAVQSWLRRRRAPEEVAIVELDQVAVGDTVPFAYHDEPCLLFRPDEHTLLAYNQKCSHLSCAVIPDMKNDCIRCPCHHGAFDLASGRPIAGPPRRPLSRISLEVRAGVIHATGMELKTI